MKLVPPVRIFISYSHEDREYKDRLVEHLAVLLKQKAIEAWHDGAIDPGQEWEDEILARLEDAHIIVLLISSSFLAFRLIWEVELQKAMARHDVGTAQVIPVFCRDCDWKDAPFGRLQGIPRDTEPKSAMPDADKAFTLVAKALRKAVVDSAEAAPPEPVTPLVPRAHAPDGLPLDLWTPGPTEAQLISHYTPLVGLEVAAQLWSLSRQSIDAVARGDFAELVALGERLRQIAGGNRYLHADASYLLAEGHRLLAHLTSEPEQKVALRSQALAKYRRALELQPDDPRPTRRIGRVLQAERQYDKALRNFEASKGLYITGLASASAEARPDLAHEALRTSRHLIHCLLEIRDTNPLSSWHHENKRQVLEAYLVECDHLHRNYMPVFKSFPTWSRIEWFMGLVFMARAWDAVGNTEKSKQALVYALQARRQLLGGQEPLSSIERINLEWWLSGAVERFDVFDSDTQRQIEKLTLAVEANDKGTVQRAADDLLLPYFPPWEGMENSHETSPDLFYEFPMKKKARYDIALSFAGEDRDYASAVADEVKSLGLTVFYDEYERAALWGKDLYQHLDEVYRTMADFTVIFVSSHYRKKNWTKHELRSAQARALEENREYLLPVRLDDTEIPGLPPTIGYVDGNSTLPKELAALILAKTSGYGKP